MTVHRHAALAASIFSLLLGFAIGHIFYLRSVVQQQRSLIEMLAHQQCKGP